MPGGSTGPRRQAATEGKATQGKALFGAPTAGDAAAQDAAGMSIREKLEAARRMHDQALAAVAAAEREHLEAEKAHIDASHAESQKTIQKLQEELNAMKAAVLALDKGTDSSGPCAGRLVARARQGLAASRSPLAAASRSP